MLIHVQLAHKKNDDDEALGRSRGGFSTKIHATVDALGNPLRLKLSAGQRHDITQAHDLVDGFDFDVVIADRGYASQDFVDRLVANGILVVIPAHQRAKTKRDYDHWLYKERHLVECFFNKIKHFRRVFSRYDKQASRYLGFVQFVSVLVWLR